MLSSNVVLKFVSRKNLKPAHVKNLLDNIFIVAPGSLPTAILFKFLNNFQRR